MTSSAVKRFLLANYYTLHHFQELVVQYRVHYDRVRFRRIYHTFSRYCLFQYRELFPYKQHAKRYLNYPLYIDNQPIHLRFQKYFFLFYAIRCFSISCIKWTTDSEWKRIWIGTEFIRKESFFIETTFLFWSTIGVLYLTFSLPKSLLDYKHLAILRLSPKRPEYLRPSDLGLTNDQLMRLHRFRKVANFFLHNSMTSIPFFGPICVVLLYIRASLYVTHLAISIFWTVILCYWIYSISALLYTNLVAFIVVSKYIHIKQQSIAHMVEQCFTQLQQSRNRIAVWRRSGQSLWNRFIELNTRYTFLQDELKDYNRFWSKYLTFIFVLYVVLIGFILFIIILTDIIFLVKFTYGIVLFVNMIMLCAIIYYGGKIVLQNASLSTAYSSLLGHYVHSQVQLPTYQTVKVNNMGMYLKELCAGFTLLNGYVITYDTLRLLLVNITIYFVLIIKKIIY